MVLESAAQLSCGFQWNTVVGGTQDQNVGKEELDQRHGFESECSSDSFTLCEPSKAWLTAFHSLCSAAASAQLCFLQMCVLETSSTVWALVSAYSLCLQDQRLVLYGGFFIGSKNILFVEPPVGIKQTALREKKVEQSFTPSWGCWYQWYSQFQLK